jgi:hypothetical protein
VTGVALVVPTMHLLRVTGCSHIYYTTVSWRRTGFANALSMVCQAVRGDV